MARRLGLALTRSPERLERRTLMAGDAGTSALVAVQGDALTYDQATALWSVHRMGSGAVPPAVPSFNYGASGFYPVVGDWDGDGAKSIGVYDSLSGTWYLRNSVSAGAPDVTPFTYGGPGWLPVVGDWDGDGIDTVGVVQNVSSAWLLRNSNTSGGADAGQFVFGSSALDPVVGDWNDDGRDTIGAFDPITATWYLRNSLSAGAPDVPVFSFGSRFSRPLVGDWNPYDSSFADGIGVWTEQTAWYFRNTATAGPPELFPFAPFTFGSPYGAADGQPYAFAIVDPPLNGGSTALSNFTLHATTIETVDAVFEQL